MAKRIVKQALKDNQPTLRQQAKDLCASATPHQSPHFSIVGTGAESAGFVGVSAQSGLEHRGGQGG
jgi:hypothetical protein